MPKKRKQTYQIKPQSSVHPSLASNTTSQQHASASTPPPTQVNELLVHLRRAQGASRSSTSAGDSETPTPSAPTVNVSLLYPPSEHQPESTQTPRERWLARARQRRVPGPAAPPSWTRKQAPRKSHTQLEEEASNSATRMDRLPDLTIPPRGSLRFMLMRKLATEWHDMRDIYDDDYFSGPDGLAQHLKTGLLAFLSVYGPPVILIEDLEVLFRDFMSGDELYPGANGVSHLHLGYVTNPVRDRKGYKGLANFLFGGDYLRYFAESKHDYVRKNTDLETKVPDSWDVEDEEDMEAQPSLSIKTINAPRFSSLTHLSFAHAHFASWRFLLRDLTPHLTQLTHLSLAYWPQPCLTPNARTATISSPMGHVDVSATSFYNAMDGDWTEAVAVMQQLGKDLLCLKWLDLEGCSLEGGWAQALMYSGSRQIKWGHTFSGLETLIIGQGRTPSTLTNYSTRDQFIKEWLTWASLIMRGTGMSPQQLLVVSDYRFKKLLEQWRAEGHSITGLEALRLVEWLERENHVQSIAKHIRLLRRHAGIVQDITVIGTPYPKWAMSLVGLSSSDRRAMWQSPSIDYNLLRAIGFSEDELTFSINNLIRLRNEAALFEDYGRTIWDP